MGGAQAALPGGEAPWEVITAAIGRPFARADWERALAERRVVLEREWGVALWRFRKDVGPVERGSVLAPEGFIWTFPHIARVAHLERGIRKHFEGPFAVEEKIDGYNVRVVRLGGRVLALTRNGSPCPFATDRLVDFPGVLRLLEREPGTILCAEIAGRGNPYNVLAPPWLDAEVALFAFDLGSIGRRRFMPPERRARVCADYGIRAAPLFGRFEPGQAAAIYEILRELDVRGGEGVALERGVARLGR